MAVRKYKRTKRQAIFRQDLQARSNVSILDARNNPTGTTVTPYTLESCTIQPVSGAELKTLEEGYRDCEIFTIFTATPARTVQRGTSNKPDEVFLDTPYTITAGWFTVIRSKVWQNNTVPHYQLTIVRKNPD